MLGGVQIAFSIAVNATVVLAAGWIAHLLATRPTWQLVQRWVMGTALAALAVRIALDGKR